MPRILCVDDEPALRDVLCILLRREGYEVTGVGSGSEAWRLLAAGPPSFDLLITDNDMPGMNGTRLVQKLRDAGQPLKIIVFSASLTPEDEAGFRACQVDALVAKGAAIDELLCEIRRISVEQQQNA